MNVLSLQSGSNGNCIYVEAGPTRLLIDAGISGRQAELRLAEHGRDIRDVTAVVVSHDHSDHAKCIGVFQRKFGLGVYVTPATLAAAREKFALGRLDDVRPFRAGDKLAFDGLDVQTIPTPHDGVDGVAFVLDDGRRRLGVLTDLGHCFDGLGEVIAGLDAVFVESNYDPEMLAAGPYPAYLKRRILGSGGHLSNAESAELVKAWASPRLRWACLAHLSEQNNNPQMALDVHRRTVGRYLPVHLASRYHVGDLLEV
jgi:phosphoribosyl 1,2-cyclic phosphodiesterase